MPSPNNCQLSKDNYFVLEDGMTPAYNELLYQLLKDVAHSKKTGFFTDSFKVLTRNFLKQLANKENEKSLL